MKNLDFIDFLFFDENLTMYDMKKGLTNTNYLVETHGQRFVLRVPHPDHANIVNRHHETLALHAIACTDIDVELIYYDEASGYKVTRFLEDAKTYSEYNGQDNIERVAGLMRRFHQLNVTIKEAFDPIAHYHQYHKAITKPMFNTKPFHYLLDKVKEIPYQSCLCHNDWVDGNILFTQKQTYLIDYEYAADNDPLFDVMSFLSENKIYDPKQRERFYAVYFDNITEEIRYHLTIWEGFHNLLWCTWAMMMFEHRQNPIYLSIANDKYQALQNFHQL